MWLGLHLGSKIILQSARLSVLGWGNGNGFIEPYRLRRKFTFHRSCNVQGGHVTLMYAGARKLQERRVIGTECLADRRLTRCCARLPDTMHRDANGAKGRRYESAGAARQRTYDRTRLPRENRQRDALPASGQAGATGGGEGRRQEGGRGRCGGARSWEVSPPWATAR